MWFRVVCVSSAVLAYRVPACPCYAPQVHVWYADSHSHHLPVCIFPKKCFRMIRKVMLCDHKSISDQSRYYYGNMIRSACDEGVTEIIGFVLIMGLVVVVLFGMALIVPPLNGAAIEGELALGAVQSVSNLKYDMDLLWESPVMKNVNRSVLIQLSTPRRGIVSMLPVFTPRIGSATMSAGVSGVTVKVDGTQYGNLLRLSYATSNNYAPDSMVVYEAGAVFAGTRDSRSQVLVPSVGRASNGSLLMVLPRLADGVESSVSGNSFGVVEYRLIDTNVTSYSNPQIMINGTGESTAAAKSLADLISDTVSDDGTISYSGTVRVMTANYSVVMRGAVP